MVTADSDCKAELERRRKMRLSQVRQQSDEIATKVRQRVQSERNKQVKNKEERDDEQWKLSKLLELQAQYCDSLRNLGLAHAQAIIEEAREEVNKEYKEALMDRCKQRGREAAKKLHKEQEEREKDRLKELGNKKSESKKTKSPVRQKKRRKKCERCDSCSEMEDIQDEDEIIDVSESDDDVSYKDAVKQSKKRGYKAAVKLHKEQEEKEKQKQKEFEERRKRSTTEAIRKSNKSPFRKKKKRKKYDKNESDSSGMECSHEEDDEDFKFENDRISPCLRDYLDKGTKSRSKSPSNLRRKSPDKSARSPSPKTTRRSPSPKVTSRSPSPKVTRISSPNSSGGSSSPKSPRRSPSPPRKADIIIHHPDNYLDKCTTNRSKSPRGLKISKSTNSRTSSPPKLADIMIHHPPDTRISDRIKNRRLRLHTDTILDEKVIEKSVVAEKDVPIKLMVSTGTLTEAEKDGPCCLKCRCKSNHSKAFQETKMEDIGTITENDLIPLKIHTTKCDCCLCSKKKDKKLTGQFKKRNSSNEIPPKPTVILKNKSKSDSDKAQFYDHINRFSKEYQPPQNQVQRIPDCDIQIVDAQSDNEFQRTMQKRDKEAQIRGKKAYEKEKIQKDYNELIQKLPALQRQERMASLAVKNGDNPAFHMSDNRLKQQELKKQCEMEGAFEKLFPHTITLKSKSHPDDAPFQVIDTVDQNQIPPYRWDLNVDFNIEEKNGVVLTKDDGVITINPNVSDQTDNLKIMLEKLKQQKRMLLEEVETLPRDSNLDSIISELERFRNDNERKSDINTKLSDDLIKSHKKKSQKEKSKTKKSHKTHHKVLQNTSTQTSPKIEIPIEQKLKETDTSNKESKIDLKKETKKKKIKSTPSNKSLSSSKLNESDKIKKYDNCECLGKCCKCDKNDICEIVIKIQDDVPQINIKSPKKTKIESKTLLIDTVSNESILNQKENVPKKKSVEIISKPSIKLKKDVLLENKIDSKLSWSKSLMNTPGEPSTSTSYFSPPDFQKPLSELPPEKNKEALLKYIKKLLTMSRKSVENLRTSGSTSLESSLSNVTNTSAASLALKLFETTLQNMEKQLITSSTSSNSIKSYDYDASISNNHIKNQNDVYDNKLEIVAEKYENMVDQCHKRISGLTAMIEKVRKEREQILSPNFSDKEPSTAYLNLPNSIGEENKSSSLPSENEESDREQKLLNKLLLDVNINIEKLNEQAARFDSNSRSSSPDRDIVDAEVYHRFKNLMNVEENDEQVIRDMINENLSEEFVPMINIPRLPKLRPRFAPYVEEIYYDKQKKPPPAKGLSAAKKFNGEITNVPHELSTIAEVDSQLSTKISPQKQDQKVIREKPSHVETEFDPNKSNRDYEAHISQESVPDVVVALKSGESSSSNNSDEREKQKNDGSNSSDMENLEAMLASMGMGWAIATLRKTQNALVKNGSTSSSEEIRKHYKNASDSSTSDITLRDYLGRKIFSTSSNYGSASTTMSPFRRELEDISVIHGSAMSSEYKQLRTSTPVGITNISEGQRIIGTQTIMNDNSSNADGFVTLPEVSID
nr:uncharacterized protein LOC111427849 [Onthophagus taurus]